MEWRLAIVSQHGKFVVRYESRMSLPEYKTVDYPSVDEAGNPKTITRAVNIGMRPTRWMNGDVVKSFYTAGAAHDWLKDNAERLMKGRKVCSA